VTVSLPDRLYALFESKGLLPLDVSGIESLPFDRWALLVLTAGYCSAVVSG
jgi:hypothetical protein